MFCSPLSRHATIDSKSYTCKAIALYLESISFDTLGFEMVVVGVEVFKCGGKHRKFDKFVLREVQVLQEGQLGEGPIFNFRNTVPRQVNPLQSHCGQIE